MTDPAPAPGPRIHVWRPPDGFNWIQPVDPDDYARFRFDGTSRAAAWTPVPMKLLTRSESGRREKPTDFPFGTTQLVLSERATNVLRGVLISHGELLPLTSVGGGVWWVFNATRVIPALDVESSEVLRSPDNPERILYISKHVFLSDVITRSGAEIFRLSEMADGDTYFTDAFCERIRHSGLTGLEFRQVS